MTLDIRIIFYNLNLLPLDSTFLHWSFFLLALRSYLSGLESNRSRFIYLRWGRRNLLLGKSLLLLESCSNRTRDTFGDWNIIRIVFWTHIHGSRLLFYAFFFFRLL